VSGFGTQSTPRGAVTSARRQTGPQPRVTHANELTEADRAASVISDEIVDLGWKSRHRRLSDHPMHNGVEIQAYCAMIVCMLILIYTSEKPNRAMYQMVWYELIGLASLKELEAFIRTPR
jgi:hypothetical protein